MSSAAWGKSSILVAAVCLLIAACTDGGGETTTTTAANVEFGSGAVPDTVPESFPLPQGSVISSTLVNRDTGFTEMIVRMGLELGAAVQFYTQNLPDEFEIGDSAPRSDSEWEMTANGAGVDVEMRFRRAQPEVTEGVFTFRRQ